MSNPESFVDEVTEAVRRDKLYAGFRKYGWIGILLVVAIVGGAAWNEWSKSKTEARAEAFGDAVMDAVVLEDSAARAAALQAVPASLDQVAVLRLLQATDPQQDVGSKTDALDKLIADASLPEMYRDLAVLKRVTLMGKEQPLAERRAALESIAGPGRVFRPLAQEQLGYLLMEEDKKAEALTLFQALVQDEDAPDALKGRAGDMVTILGAALGTTQAG